MTQNKVVHCWEMNLTQKFQSECHVLNINLDENLAIKVSVAIFARTNCSVGTFCGGR